MVYLGKIVPTDSVFSITEYSRGQVKISSLKSILKHPDCSRLKKVGAIFQLMMIVIKLQF
ncbi:hypothetical protein RV10_GL002265 [Enterococcus pallens]|nr:hypothetical protein RV10_GL002265 [Enterococcus pallens]